MYERCCAPGQEEDTMSACAMQTYNNVTQAAWQSAKQTVPVKFGVQITSDSGNASSGGYTVHWNYDSNTEILSIQCTDSPLLVPCSFINSEINNMVEATLNQHNIVMARMVPT
jgi:hypothetical protein